MGDKRGDAPAAPSTPPPTLADAAPWVKELATGDGVVQILSADDLEKQAHAFLRADHVVSEEKGRWWERASGRERQHWEKGRRECVPWPLSQPRPPCLFQTHRLPAPPPPPLPSSQFSALLRHDMVRDLVALYAPPARRMSYVVHLGDNVCGYPRVVHGGLTAAMVDEAMGHLFYALRSHGDLPFAGPAFTAHLEVDYHRKISAGRLLLVTAEVEGVAGRKLRMRATVTDGPPGRAGTTTYASATALFVAPRPVRLLKEVVRYLVALVVPGARFD